MYLLTTFDLTEKEYKDKNHEKIYKLLESIFNFKRTWDTKELPNTTMIGEFSSAVPYMQVYSKIKNELKCNGIKVEKMFIYEISFKHAFVEFF